MPTYRITAQTSDGCALTYDVFVYGAVTTTVGLSPDQLQELADQLPRACAVVNLPPGCTAVTVEVVHEPRRAYLSTTEEEALEVLRQPGTADNKATGHRIHTTAEGRAALAKLTKKRLACWSAQEGYYLSPEGKKRATELAVARLRKAGEK